MTAEKGPQPIEEIIEGDVAIGRVFLLPDGSEVIAIRRGLEGKYFEQDNLPEELKDPDSPWVIPVNDIRRLPRDFENILDFAKKKRTLGLLYLAHGTLNPPVKKPYEAINIKPKKAE